MTLKILVAMGCLGAILQVSAREDLKLAPARMVLRVAGDTPREKCRGAELLDDLQPVLSVSLHRTFDDGFEKHPLSQGVWSSHYTGDASWPEPLYWGGEGSDLKRKTKYNGEQQIYVDPRYGGRMKIPLGLDPFKVRDGILSIVASRTPPVLKSLLFDNEYVSGILTTQKSFTQKYGYFEIRSKIPVGTGVWPAFWLLAENGSWPPEIDVLEGQGQRPDAFVMTTHWRKPDTGLVEHCGKDFVMSNASSGFHNYGMLWQINRLTFFVDRQAVSDIKVPPGFEHPMYMIVNLAMGSSTMEGVGFVGAETPRRVEFEVDRISAYQIDSN